MKCRTALKDTEPPENAGAGALSHIPTTLKIEYVLRFG
jgi:hypothetical protein